MSLLDDGWCLREGGRRWVVGVSGGRDSVVLLDSLLDAGVNDLVVVHVNHGLRGEASDGDEDFVRGVAEVRGLDFLVERFDVGALAEEAGKGLETMAREVRHRVFLRAVREFGCVGVLLGHHADDQAETVLFNLLRGSAGLKGMRVESEVDGLRIGRPLLGVRRGEIDSWLAERGLVFREDATNAEGFTVRNRMRGEVLPLLAEVMGRDVVGAITGALEESLGCEDFVDAAFDYEGFLDPQGRLFLPILSEAKEVVRGRVMFRYLRECGVPDVSRAVVGRCLGLLGGGAAKVNLPGGGWMRRKEKRLFFEGCIS